MSWRVFFCRSVLSKRGANEPSSMADDEETLINKSSVLDLSFLR